MKTKFGSRKKLQKLKKLYNIQYIIGREIKGSIKRVIIIT